MAFTQHHTYSCNVKIKIPSNSCNSNYIGSNIIYNKSRDTEVPKDYIECITVKQLQTLPESSDFNISETLKE